MITLGVFSNTIGGATPEDVATRTAQAGVETVQLRLEWPGLDLSVARPTARGYGGRTKIRGSRGGCPGRLHKPHGP